MRSRGDFCLVIGLSRSMNRRYKLPHLGCCSEEAIARGLGEVMPPRFWRFIFSIPRDSIVFPSPPLGVLHSPSGVFIDGPCLVGFNWFVLLTFRVFFLQEIPPLVRTKSAYPEGLALSIPVKCVLEWRPCCLQFLVRSSLAELSTETP